MRVRQSFRFLLTADLNVFTLNKRSVMLIQANLGQSRESVPIAFVAIGGKFIARGTR
jgi:phosphatidylserine decarboxylase